MGGGEILGEAAKVATAAFLEGRQQQRDLLRPVTPGRRRAAAIAATAGGHQLTHRQQQGLLAAAFPLCHRLHAAQLALDVGKTLVLRVTGAQIQRSPTSLLSRRADRPAQADPIERIEQHLAAGRQAIAPRPARLLQIALGAGRQIEMQHQPHVGPVDTHAEGHGGHQHRSGVLHEVLQSQLAAVGIHAGVIGDGLHAGRGEAARPLLHRTSGAGVDQDRSAGVSHGFQELGQRIGGPQRHAVGEVGAAGGAHLHQGTPQLQQADDVGTHPRRRRGAQGHQRHAGTETAQLTEAAVVGSEVVAPGTDAVGLIHGDGHHAPGIEQIIEQLAGGLALQPFRRQIEQAQLLLLEHPQQAAALAPLKARVKAGGAYTPAAQLLHLVLHQRHQWRDDQHQTLAHQGWELIAEGFASAGGENGQAVAARQERLHHLALARPEGLPAEVALQRLQQRIRLQHHHP